MLGLHNLYGIFVGLMLFNLYCLVDVVFLSKRGRSGFKLLPCCSTQIGCLVLTHDLSRHLLFSPSGTNNQDHCCTYLFFRCL